MPTYKTLAIVGPLLLAGSAFLLAGCKGEDDAVKVYKAPKEPAAGANVATGKPAGGDHALENPAIELAWTAPSAWKPTEPPQFADAAFITPEGLTASVSILSRAGGDPLANVNRWRGQLGLAPTTEAEIENVTAHLHIGDLEAMGVDFTGKGDRILATIIPAGPRSYFFKLMGAADKVAAQQANFDAWMKSLRPMGAPAPAVTPPAAPAATPKAEAPKVETPKAEAPKPAAPAPVEAPKPAADASKPAVEAPKAEAPKTDAPKIAGIASYTLPAGWTVDTTPKPMRAATINITKGGAQATIIVSRLGAGAFGDKLSNVNRWRQQVGLPPTENADAHPAAPVQLAQGPVDLFDFAGAEGADRKRQYVAVTRFPKAAETWFFRFIGPHEGVTASAADFDAFLKSLKFEQ